MNIWGMILGIAVMLSVLGGANYYVARKLYQWIGLFVTNINVKVYIGVYIFFAFSMILGFMRSLLPIPMIIKNILNWLSAFWMGIFLYLLLLFVVTDLVILLGSAVKIVPRPLPQNIRFCAGLMVVLLTIGLVSYGMYNATQIKHVSYDIQVSETTLSPEMNIVLVSDLHLGALNSESNLVKVVQGINDMEPDVVCLAGDIFNDDYGAIHNPEEAIELLKGINAKYGVYACLGNHDGGSTFNDFISFLEQSNITLLNDEYVIIDERLVLFGRVDSSPIGGLGELQRKDDEEIKETIASLDTNIPVVVMDHNPSNIEQYGGEVDLILAGHTHRGQIFPGSLITNAMYIVDYGHYQKDADSPHVIVTSGAGTWGMPMRVGTNSEIVSILLR